MAELIESPVEEAPGAELLKLPAQSEQIGLALRGDARLVPGGQFLGGVRLAGHGWIESGAVDLFALLQTHRTLTLDFRICPDAGAHDAILFTLPARKPFHPLSIVRASDGTLRLVGLDGPILTHPRRAAAGQWTHIALVLSNLVPSNLLVDGAPAPVPAEQAAHLSDSLRAAAAPRFLIGGDTSGEGGFAGTVDSVRLTRGERPFFEKGDLSWCDPDARRPIETRPPWFARGRSLNVRCSFDRTLQPEDFAGVAARGTEASAAALAPGVRGSALDLASPAATNFALAGRAALPLDRGTVELWFLPRDWDNEFVGNEFGSDVRWLPVLRFAHKDSPPSRGLRLLRVAQGRSRPDVRSGRPWIPFNPGKWTHLVCTWDGGSVAVYLDGKPQPIGQAVLAGAMHPDDAKAFEQWTKDSAGKDDGSYELRFLPSATLVDELRVYPWALTAEEVNNAYVRYFPDARSRLVELPRLLASASYDYYQQVLTLQVACQPVNDVEPAAVAVRLTAKGSATTLFNAEKVALDASLKARTGGYVVVPYADYALEVRSVAADGRELMARTLDWAHRQPEWWQNTLGKDAVVPKPWTPVRAGETTASVWGREFAFGGGGLVTGLVSAAAQLLAAPPHLYGRAAGADLAFRGEPPTLVEESDAAAAWRGELRAREIRATVQADLEYDGLLRYAVRLAPAGGAPAELESLTLDFPLRREVATQFIVNGGGHNFRASWLARFIPEGRNAVWNSSGAPGHKAVIAGSFCPVVWIGDDRRGLCFFGENDRGWTPDGHAPAQQLVRDGDRVIYRMNVIARPVRIEREREFTFYLHPTPTKPLPPDWRRLNARGKGGKGTTRDGVDAFLGYTLTAPSTVFNAGITFATEPVSWEDAARNAAQLRQKINGEPVMFYIDCSWPRMGSSMDEFKPTLWWTGRMTWTREVEDYLVWVINEYLRRGILDGIYVDDVSCNRTLALDYTAYKLEDGRPQPGFSTMGFRRFLKRVWVLFDQADKRPIILPHATYCFEIPALSFAECTVNGEDRDIGPFAEHRYPDVWSPEELRVMGSSEKWGFVCFWKPGVRADFDYRFDPRARAWIYRQSRAMHALVIPHDYWYLWTWPTANAIRPALANFGADDPDVRFIPYWDLGGRASVTGGPRLLLSVFAKPDRALLMVSNLAKQDQDVTVTVSPRKLFGAAAPEAVAWADGDSSLGPVRETFASRQELQKVRDQMLSGTDLERDGAVDASGQGLEDFLDDRRPGDAEAECLRLRPEGAAVRVLVRGQDYRLLTVRPAAP